MERTLRKLLDGEGHSKRPSPTFLRVDSSIPCHLPGAEHSKATETGLGATDGIFVSGG